MNSAIAIKRKNNHRPRSLKLTDLKPGMKFDAPVYFEGENLFVEAGLPVRDRDIRKLRAMGIEAVMTTGLAIGESAEPEKPPTPLHVFYLKAEEARCLKEYVNLRTRVRILFSRLAKKEPVEKSALDDAINAVFRLTRENPNEMVQVLHAVDAPAADPAAAALHATIIAVVMGCQKKTLGHDLLSLATAAFFHDVGMLFLPAPLREKKGKLDARELEVMKTHPALSYTVLRDLGYPIGVANAVLDHHERWDGRGYPRRVPGARIHPQALIVAVADAYTALIDKKPYRRYFLGYDAVKTILHGVGHQWSPDAVKLLVKGVGMHPLGTVVLLNNFSLGRVIETREESALRPKVEIIRDKHGDKITPPHEVDLTVRKDLYIVKAIDPAALSLS